MTDGTGPRRDEDGPRFIADCMLGRLARWLRILGYDVAYETRISDDAIIIRSRREGRVLLTRDTRLAARRALRGGGAPGPVLIRAGLPAEQLLEMVREHGLAPRPERLLSRCLPCNEPNEPAAREEVKGLVPPYVYRTQRSFSRCPACGRIYWRATHVKSILERLAKGMPGDGR